jgi:hypothetical protein
MDDLEKLLRGLGVIEFKILIGERSSLTVEMSDGAMYGVTCDTLDQAFDKFVARMEKEGRWRRG